MEKVILNHVERCCTEGTELELTVRGHKVTALFLPEPNPRIYRQLKQIMIDTCSKNCFVENTAKIGQI